jgi:hypothetical protein
MINRKVDKIHCDKVIKKKYTQIYISRSQMRRHVEMQQKGKGKQLVSLTSLYRATQVRSIKHRLNCYGYIK